MATIRCGNILWMGAQLGPPAGHFLPDAAPRTAPIVLAAGKSAESPPSLKSWPISMRWSGAGSLCTRFLGAFLNLEPMIPQRLQEPLGGRSIATCLLPLERATSFTQLPALCTFASFLSKASIPIIHNVHPGRGGPEHHLAMGRRT